MAGGTVTTERLGGDDRYATAVQISRHQFPHSFRDGQGRVYLARGDEHAHALAAGSLTDGPVLLVPACAGVPNVVRQEVQRLDPGEVVALGGSRAVCDATLEAAADGRETGRLGGADRYETAALISRHAFPNGAGEVYLAGGRSPDAVAGGSLAGGPILLTGTSGLPGASAQEIARLAPGRVVALGGNEPVPNEVLAQAATGRQALRAAGADRYATAVEIARYGFPGGTETVYLARGDIYADAVTGGVLTDGPILLVPGDCRPLPDVVAGYLRAATPNMVIALGGEAAVCPQTLRAAQEAATPPAPNPVEQPTDRPNPPAPDPADDPTDGPSDPARPEDVELTEEAEILTDEQTRAITDFDPDSGEVRFVAGEVDLADIEIGDVLVAGVTDATPEGLLRRITGADTAGGEVIYSTEQAALTDVISDTGGPVVVTGDPILVEVEDLDGAQVIEESHGQMGVFSAPAPANPEVTFSIGRTWSASTTSGNLEGQGSAKIAGRVTTGARAELLVDIGWGGAGRIRATVTPYASTSADLTLEGAFSGSIDHTFAKTTRVWAFAIGPVPVAVTETSGVKLSLGTEIAGSVSVGTRIYGEITAGVDYRNGEFSPVLDPHGTAEVNGFNPTANATATVALGPTSDAKFYGVAGITAGLSGYITAGMAVTPDAATCSWDAGVRGTAGVVTGINVLGVKLEDRRTANFNVPLAGDEYDCIPHDPDNPGGPGPGPGPGDPDPDVPTGEVTISGLLGDGTWRSFAVPEGASEIVQLAGQRSPQEVDPWGDPVIQFLALDDQGRVWRPDGSQVLGIPPMAQIAYPKSRLGNAMALSTSGEVWVWGRCWEGLLGLGDAQEPNIPNDVFAQRCPTVPTRVPGLSRIVSVHMADRTAYAIGHDGTLWSWGDDLLAEEPSSALQNFAITWRPTRVPVPPAAQVDGDGDTRYVRTRDGEVYTYGLDPLAAARDLCHFPADPVVCWNGSPERIDELEDVVDISIRFGRSGVLSLTQDGSVFYSGSGNPARASHPGEYGYTDFMRDWFPWLDLTLDEYLHHYGSITTNDPDPLRPTTHPVITNGEAVAIHQEGYFTTEDGRHFAMGLSFAHPFGSQRPSLQTHGTPVRVLRGVELFDPVDSTSWPDRYVVWVVADELDG